MKKVFRLVERIVDLLSKPRTKGKPCRELMPSDLSRNQVWGLDTPETIVTPDSWARPLGFQGTNSWTGFLLIGAILRPASGKSIVGAIISKVDGGSFRTEGLAIFDDGFLVVKLTDGALDEAERTKLKECNSALARSLPISYESWIVCDGEPKRLAGVLA